MKKVAVTVAVLALGLAACNKNEAANNTANETAVENNAETDVNALKPPTAISPAMRRSGTKSARSTSPKARSSARSTEHWDAIRLAAWSISAPAPGG